MRILPILKTLGCLQTQHNRDPNPKHNPTISLIGPIPWGHSGPPLSCVVVVVVVVVVGVVDIDAQAARDSTGSDTW